MIKINLVPADILAKAHQRQQMLQLGAVGAVIAAIVVTVSLGHLYKLNKLERQLADDEGRLKKLEVIVAEVEQLEKTRDAVRARLNVVTDLLKGRKLYPVFMSDFVRSVPPGVRVRTLGTQGGGSAMAPLKLTIAAECRTDQDIADWIKKLEDSGRFTGVELGPVSGSGGGDSPTEKTYSFTLTGTYTPSL